MRPSKMAGQLRGHLPKPNTSKDFELP